MVDKARFGLRYNKLVVEQTFRYFRSSSSDVFSMQMIGLSMVSAIVDVFMTSIASFKSQIHDHVAC